MVELAPGIAKLAFAMGAHGLEWEGTEIVRVSCQARLLGVKPRGPNGPGWSINMIAGNTVSDSQQIWAELSRCKKLGAKYQIYFVKDEASIKADQAKAAAEAKKKQEEAEERKRKEDNAKRIQEQAEQKRKEEQAAKKQASLDQDDGGGDGGGGGDGAAPASSA